MSRCWIRCWIGCASALAAFSTPVIAGEPPTDRRPFRIEVVDDETGRGVPLVELRTVNQIRYVTDSNGVVAFDEPGLMGLKVFFSVKSHGYEFAKDGFGIAGAAIDVRPGGEARLKIKRVNVARRLFRVTGAGIYRDSLLTGVPIPIREPVLDGQVLGQDSVLNAVYQGKIHWFWGDTNRPGYPLGNFHSPGAVSDLPGKGGLDPAKGVDLTYFVDDKGFARPTCNMPGEGPTWITGLVVLTDDQGRERMFANYAKVKPPMTIYERGIVEFDPKTQTFEKRAQFAAEKTLHPAGGPGGHTFIHRDDDAAYVYYSGPYPLIRVPADPDKIVDPDACEVFTCLEPGTRADQGKLDRTSDGRLNYGWKKHTDVIGQQEQAKFVRDGKMKAEEGLLQLRDIETGKTVLAHGGSVYWNPYRKRWISIAVEAGGRTSYLGEVWFSEADTPLGPWVYARKIATHDDYSFYNPKQHPMFDQENGRIVYFEGTYTSTFSGAKDVTPRYDYNQVMYQLDLADPRLALPAPVFEVEASGLAFGWAVPEGVRSRSIAFFAPDRAGVATIAAGSRTGGEPLFYMLPADSELAETTPIYEYSRDGSGLRTYSIDPARPETGSTRSASPVGRVWKNPGPSRVW
ncbi:hypothetical protein [Paludisphaera borealis]|uniref:Uncharacterized protein n=1 Tax=Paludisphaera borealis TaxID=1387353 RepID=A0A1U7CKG7_9BACT|nr:hypothetical protein [Paludisphaera borealis]APW59373.1 hypothetical protein BSF38_00795 [Paludisphaera borealis]